MFYVRCLQRGIFLPQAVKQQQNAEVDLTQQKRIRKLEPVTLFSSPKFDRKGFLFLPQACHSIILSQTSCCLSTKCHFHAIMPLLKQ